MIDNKVIYLPVTYLRRNFRKDFILNTLLDSIDQGNFLIDYRKGIVADARWQRPQTFKQGFLIIVHAYITYSIINSHIVYI